MPDTPSPSCESLNVDNYGRLDSSPLVQVSNRLLYGARGVLIRVPDAYNVGLFPKGTSADVDNTLQMAERGDAYDYKPASFLHASMRAPRPVFRDFTVHSREQMRYAVGILTGTKFRSDSNAGKDPSSVKLVSIYARDANTLHRDSMRKASGGYGCHKVANKLKADMDEPRFDSQCRCMLPRPEKTGDWMVEYSRRLHRKLDWALEAECSYVDPKDAIAASNSLYVSRRDWYRPHTPDPESYRGYNEAVVTGNADEPRVMDAVVIKLPVIDRVHARDVFVTCDSKPRLQWTIHRIQRDLEYMRKLGYGSLPVVFLAETRGMEEEECQQYWGGKDCQEGFRKEFFSQTFNFTDSSCLAVPPGCNDVYYFGVDSSTGSCSVDSLPADETFSCRNFESDLLLLKDGLASETARSRPLASVEPISSFDSPTSRDLPVFVLGVGAVVVAICALVFFRPKKASSEKKENAVLESQKQVSQTRKKMSAAYLLVAMVCGGFNLKIGMGHGAFAASRSTMLDGFEAPIAKSTTTINPTP